MAPRLRSRKVLLPDEVLAYQEMLRVANTTGLPALPTEILLEIVSYFPSVPIPDFRTTVYPKSYLQRIKVLQALSQMCRSLRSVFLPLTWQRLDICATHWVKDTAYWPVPKHWKKDLATELVRQLEIVTVRDPTLAPYVKIVNVFFTDYRSATVIPEFARCLALFPNLHTIQILGDGSVQERYMDQEFIGRVFPTVHTIVVPKFAYAIVKACPHARSVTNASVRNYLVFHDIAKYCPDLEELRGFSDMNYSNFYGGSFFQKLREHFPKTRVIVLDAVRIVARQTMEELAQFPALQCIEINIPSKQQEQAGQPFNLFVKQAMDVLRGMPEPENGGRRCVVVVFKDTRCRHIVR